MNELIREHSSWIGIHTYSLEEFEDACAKAVTLGFVFEAERVLAPNDDQPKASRYRNYNSPSNRQHLAVHGPMAEETEQESDNA
jgi:hypothetical protein